MSVTELSVMASPQQLKATGKSLVEEGTQEYFVDAHVKNLGG